MRLGVHGYETTQRTTTTREFDETWVWWNYKNYELLVYLEDELLLSIYTFIHSFIYLQA